MHYVIMPVGQMTGFRRLQPNIFFDKMSVGEMFFDGKTGNRENPLKLDFGNINIKPSFMTDLGLNPGKIVIANSLTVSLNLIKANFKKKNRR